MSKFVCIDEGGQRLEVEAEGGELIFSIDYETDISRDGGHTFENETAVIGINRNAIPNLIEWLNHQIAD